MNPRCSAIHQRQDMSHCENNFVSLGVGIVGRGGGGEGEDQGKGVCNDIVTSDSGERDDGNR